MNDFRNFQSAHRQSRRQGVSLVGLAH